MSDGEITAAAAASHGEDSLLFRELAVLETVDVTPFKTVPFELPKGWTVKKVPGNERTREYEKYYERHNRRKVLPFIADEKYSPGLSSKASKFRDDTRSSYEPGTGQRFESPRAVERHLKGHDCAPSPPASKSGNCIKKYYGRRNRQKVVPFKADEKYFPKLSSKASKVRGDVRGSRGRKSIVTSEKKCYERRKRQKVVPFIADEKYFPKLSSKASKVRSDARSPKLDDKKGNIRPCLDLPDGWLVEEVPRRNTTGGYTYKYYCVPGTGKKFRSLASVKRHLAEAEEDKPLAVMFNIASPAKKLDLKNKNSREKVSNLTFGPAKPPAKVKWVVTSFNSGECTFKPSIGEKMVAEPVVQRWASRFMISINNENRTAPNFERYDVFLAHLLAAFKLKLLCLKAGLQLTFQLLSQTYLLFRPQ